MQALYPHIGMAGVLLAEDASSGTVVNLEHFPAFLYRQHDSDRQMVLQLLEYTMRVLQAAGVRDLRLNMIGPAVPGNHSPLAHLGFFSDQDIPAVMQVLRQRQNDVLQFAFHPTGATADLLADHHSGKLRGVENVYVVDNTAMRDDGTHPTRGILAKAWARVERSL
jgi:hypothetical protein